MKWWKEMRNTLRNQQSLSWCFLVLPKSESKTINQRTTQETQQHYPKLQEDRTKQPLPNEKPNTLTETSATRTQNCQKEYNQQVDIIEDNEYLEAELNHHRHGRATIETRIQQILVGVIVGCEAPRWWQTSDFDRYLQKKETTQGGKFWQKWY